MTEKNPFFGATFAERKAAREAAEAEAKSVDSDAEQVEDKAMAPKKATRKRASKKD